MKKVILIVLTFLVTKVHGQAPPPAFFQGMDILKTDPTGARSLFFDAIQTDSMFFGSYNFIGITYADEKKYDSAIFYLKAAIRLNQKNLNHTREFTLARLCRIYTRTSNFEEAYSTALKCSSDYPDNPNFISELKDACLWSYNIKFAALDKKYLDSDPLKEYTVNGVSQEYLIMRNITIGGDYLDFKGQGYDMKNNTDVLHCTYGREKKELELVFKLSWDVGKTFVDNMPDYKTVYENKGLPIYERLGAALCGGNKTDILNEIKKLSR